VSKVPKKPYALKMESRKTIFRWLIGFAVGAALYAFFVNL